ncbi:MAG: M48 family metallopeptidase [Xenococcaceae cyanobacterium MO_188.B32]|nr:M48 family metallopeptidase [Xenococcaceae cyanobacterium MO_188.B32]
MKLSQHLVLITLSIFVSGQTALAIQPTSEVSQQNQSERKTLLLAKEEIRSAEQEDSNQKERETTAENESPSEAESAEQADNNQKDRETTAENESPSEAESATGETEEKTQPTPEEIARHQKFIEADRLYLAGDKIAAAKIYRQLKKPWNVEKTKTTEDNKPKAIYAPQKLSPGGKVYWRIHKEGLEQQLESKIFTPIELLVKKHPEFIPGHLSYASALQNDERPEEALQVLEQAVAKYPNEPKLLTAKMEADIAAERWLDASVTARQFALLNPNHTETEKFTQLADNYLEEYRGYLRSQLTANAIGGIITGAVGFALTGNLFGPISAIETTMMLMRGESAIGRSVAKKAQKRLPMMEDEEVLEYVREVGKKITDVTGRNDFEYEFHVIMDDQLNAFALPGGKVFVNAGAIMNMNSEAELAGLLAHEVAHAALSHGFQLVAKGNFTASVVQYIPYVGSAAANLIVLDYSRDMERQADLYGTKMLVSAGYAADGVRNLMVKLDEIAKEDEQPIPPAWLSTHPETKERISYMEKLIVANKLDRYAYEGVDRHSQVKEKVEQLWEDYKQTDEYKERYGDPEDS